MLMIEPSIKDTCSSMQEAVGGLNGWADINKMALNPKKQGYVDQFHLFNSKTTSHPN